MLFASIRSGSASCARCRNTVGSTPMSPICSAHTFARESRPDCNAHTGAQGGGQRRACSRGRHISCGSALAALSGSRRSSALPAWPHVVEGLSGLLLLTSAFARSSASSPESSSRDAALRPAPPAACRSRPRGSRPSHGTRSGMARNGIDLERDVSVQTARPAASGFGSDPPSRDVRR